MHTDVRRTAALAALLALALANPTGAQSLRLVSHRAAAGLIFDGSFRANAPGTGANSTALTEWFVAPFSGSLIDPRIVGYSFELRPRFVQNYATDLPASIRVRDLGTAATLSLFSGLPVSLETVYNRTSGITRGGFGTRGDFGTGSLFSVLSFSNVYLPINVSYARRSRRNVTQVRTDLIPVEIEDRIQTVRVTARNSKLHVSAAWTDQADVVGTNDFGLREIDLGHRLRWGKGSSLDSRGDWSRRTGDSPHDRRSWNERLRLQHTRGTSSVWSYGRFRSEVPTGSFAGTAVGGQLDSRLLGWLTFGIGATRKTSETEGGRVVTSYLGPRIDVRLPLPFGARFSGGASAALVRRSLSGSVVGLLQALDEEHQVDGTFLIELGNPLVDPGSIVVRSEDQSTVYLESTDYAVVTVGSITQIRVLPGSRIEQDDRLFISYAFSPESAVRERARQGSLTAGVTLGGLSLRHSRTRRDNDVTGGLELPVSGDFDEAATSVSFRGGTPIGQLRAGATHRRREGAGLDYVTDEATVSLGIGAGRRAQIFLDANARRVRDENDEIGVLGIGASSSVSLGSLALDGGLQLQSWTQRIGQDETSLLARGGIRWRIGRFDARARAHWDRRAMPGSTTSGLRLRIDLTRRF